LTVEHPRSRFPMSRDASSLSMTGKLVSRLRLAEPRS
jgi:hypothetical protein